MNSKLRKRIFQFIKITVAIYCIGGIVLWQLQDYLLFHPKPLAANEQYQIATPHRELLLPVTETDKLSVMQFFPADTTNTKGVVIYYHGNRENINRYARYATNFTKHGYEVWMHDYPGFGKTTGKRTEERFYSDAEIIYQMAAKKYAADSIIIYGRSLGTGVASYIASHYACRRLILETPYYSIPQLAFAHFPIYPTERMVRFQLPVYQYLQQVKVPVTIFHGTNDEVIPYRHSTRLKQFLKSNDEYITIEKGKHNNLNDFELFHTKLDSLLQ
jgi:uncharacterized protein